MIRLVRAELLKIRRRQATYVILIIELALAALIFLATGRAWQENNLIEFPQIYGLLFQQVAFQLGSLMAIVFAAAFVGADWNWGVLRNVVARGESRERYLLGKAIAITITLAIALVIVFASCFVLTYIVSLVYGVPVSNPLRGTGLQDLLVWLVAGFPVLLQRAAIGFAVAAIFRSQLAGAVVGIVLFLVESVVTLILTAVTISSQLVQGGFSGGASGLPQIGPEWFQYLPISIGGNIFSALPGAGGIGSGDLGSLFLQPVPVVQAFIGVFIYMFAAIAIALIALRRQEIA